MPSAVPNYLQQDPNGRVHAVFPGGVIIDRADYTPPGLVLPNADGAVSWKRTEDGSTAGLVAVVRTSGGINGAYLVAEGKEAAGSAFNVPINKATARAVSPDGNNFADVAATATNAAGANVAAIANTSGPLTGRTIIDANGASSFLQLDGPRKITDHGQFTAAVPALAGQAGSATVTFTTNVIPGVLSNTVFGAITGGGTPHILTWAWFFVGPSTWQVAFFNTHTTLAYPGGGTWAGWIRTED